MDILARLRELKARSGWSDYKIAKEAGLSGNTVSNIYVRNNTPSMPTIQAICNAFGITLGQFFSEGNMTELTDEQKELLERWMLLTPEQKEAVVHIIDTYIGK